MPGPPLHVVPFTRIQQELYESARMSSYKFNRRFMMKIAEEIAQEGAAA